MLNYNYETKEINDHFKNLLFLSLYYIMLAFI